MNGFKKNIPVLMYHRIGRPDSDSSLVISPETFSRQIRWLKKKNFHFLSLEEVTRKNGKTHFSDSSVAITFDDGFGDNYENLMAILPLPTAVFVVVNWVGQKGFMAWKQIRELAERGVTMGSHTLTHRWLPSISDHAELNQEIADSKKKIEDEIGKKVHWFSYPVGGINERVVDHVRKAGYRAAWVAGAKPTINIEDRLFSLRRIKVSPADFSLVRFAVKAYGLKSLFY